MGTLQEWRIAYARQAEADLAAYRYLVGAPELPACHSLLFLQMSEKVCKAHLCGQGVEPSVLRSSHAYIAKTLPLIARAHFARQARQTHYSHAWIIAAIRKLARRIELLAPAVDASGLNPANCEYP